MMRPLAETQDLVEYLAKEKKAVMAVWHADWRVLPQSQATKISEQQELCDVIANVPRLSHY